MQPLRSNDIRERNEKLVLHLIHTRKGISQSEVASLTGLKPPTVFRIFNILEERGVIRISGADMGPGDKKGRKPVIYSVNPDAFYAVGIDLWAQSAALVIVNFCGKIIHKSMVSFSEAGGSEDVLNLLCGLIENSLKRASLKKDRILGLGIGAPGVVDIKTGRIINYSRIEGMRDYPIKDYLEKRYKIPVHVHNNCSVIALSSGRLGFIQNAGSLFAVLIRSGVGGAFIQEGRAFVNNNKTALEIGHVSIDPKGPLCTCGRRGCLELYLSEDILRTALSADSLIELPGILRTNSKQTKKVLTEKAGYLAGVIQDTANLLGTKTFLLICRSKTLATRLSSEAEAIINTETDPDSSIRIIPIKYSPLLAGKAASDLVFEYFFKSEGGEENGTA